MNLGKRKQAWQQRKKLIQEIPTRWFFKFYKRFIKLYRIINIIVTNHLSARQMISAKEIKDLKDVMKYQKVFEVATKEMSGIECVACSMVNGQLFI